MSKPRDSKPWTIDFESQVDEPERVNAWFKQQIKIVDDAQKQEVAKLQESVQVIPRLRTVTVISKNSLWVLRATTPNCDRYLKKHFMAC